ncbi:MBL fold metallo-hydrolase [Hymenobacter daeguensis]
MDTVAAGVTQLRIQRFVNVYFVETGTPGEWVLVDTGVPGSKKTILEAADKLFYPGSHPEAIILTHGHLDHVGSAKELADHWNVPVIVHPLELPYVTGKAKYPPRDPTVGGSLAFLTRFFPTDLPNLEDRVQALDADDSSTPFLMAWRWFHTPGHAPGQLSFFREADRVLIGGDAFATCNHDSIPDILLGLPKISRCGTPFNYDWEAARKSVQTLADLAPKAIGCGHGPVITGPGAAAGLRELADNYPIPTHGRYVAEPARTDASGVEFLPPAPKDTLPLKAAIIGGSLLAAGAAWLLSGGRRKGKKESKAYRKAVKAAAKKSKGYKSPTPPPPLYRGGVGS